MIIDVDVQFCGTRDDQRRSRLVDKDGVHLVHNPKVQRSLDHLLHGELHVVAKVVKAELVVGSVGDVTLVCIATILIANLGCDDAYAQSQPLIDSPHPFGISSGQVIIDRHQVGSLAGKGIEIHGQGGDERLPLTGSHLCDLPLMEDQSTHQLDIVVSHVEDSAACLSDRGEGGNHDRFQGGAIRHPFFQDCCLSP